MLSDNSVILKWGAWYEDSALELTFPPQWDIHTVNISDSCELKDIGIEDAVSTPIDTQSLDSIAFGKKNVVIAVEDMTRPVRLEKVLQSILKRLYRAGIQKDWITFVICNGAHAPMPRKEMELKLGKSIVQDFMALNHNPYDNLSDTGHLLGTTPVKINRHFFEADLRILVGTIIPHGFAGFSSGAKLVIPGLADMPTLERTHKYVMMGFRGGVNDVETNKFRSEIETVVEKIGVDFFAGVIPNSKRELAGLFTGDTVKAHRKGVEFARKIYTAKFSKPADVVILNAYPKDSELLQADTALTPLKTTKIPIIKEKGVFVVISKCSNGFGHHSLFGPGMRLARKPIKRRYLNGHDLIVFAPGINKKEFETLYWSGYKLANDWSEVLALLTERFPGQCDVAVLPCAPLQLLDIQL